MTSTTSIPIPRAPAFAFSGVPRHWLGGARVATHLVNAVNLLFPAGERFFVRSVHAHKPLITDPVLREQVRGFERQEGHHARAHEAWFATLEAQGFRIQRFLRAYETVCFDVIEPLTPKVL